MKSWVILYKDASLTAKNAIFLPTPLPTTASLSLVAQLPSHGWVSLQVLTRSAYQPHDATVLAVYSPLPGSWFTAAYIPDWNEQMQQEVPFLSFFLLS